MKGFIAPDVKITAAIAATTPVPLCKVDGVIGKELKLACPRGTVQVGGPHSTQQLLTCARTNADGSRTYVGPYYSFYKSGAVDQADNLDEVPIIDLRGPDPGAIVTKAGSFGVRAPVLSLKR